MDFHSTRVLDVTACEDVRLVTLERPEGYSFRAGQWFRMQLETAEGIDRRTFSHAAAPADSNIEMATRLSGSAFKQALDRVEVGDVVEISPPGGRLALPDVRSVVLLVGGVGITPVRSLLRDAVSRDRDLEGVTLFYGNRSDECIPFREDLETMRANGLRLVHVLERVGGPPDAEHGFIDAEMVERHAAQAGATFVVTGPPPMVVAMERVLDQLGVGADRRIIESFGMR